jgi:hypothetical protein
MGRLDLAPGEEDPWGLSLPAGGRHGDSVAEGGPPHRVWSAFRLNPALKPVSSG